MAKTPQDRWQAENIRQYTLKVKVAKKTEGDIIAKLDAQENKAGYIKALIRADIEKKRNI